MRLKMFSKKKTPKEADSASAKKATSESSFYTGRTAEEPLGDFSVGHDQGLRRTSLHSPARRRENNNRASNREIIFLLLRTGLIVLLLAGGFFGLKIVLGKFAAPSERERTKWEESSRRMEHVETAATLPPEGATSQVLNADVIGRRLKRWTEAEQNFRSAEALERRGMQDQAVARLNQALSATPDHYASQHLLMQIQMSAQNYAQAIPLCIRLLDQDSNQWDVKMNLLQALQKAGQTEACLILADHMLDREPNNFDVLMVAGVAHRISGDAEKALELFDRILENDSGNVTALEELAAIYLDRSDWKSAISCYMELIRKEPRVDYYHDLALCYAHQEEAGKSVIFMGQAASLYGEAEVSSWLRADLDSFDPIRETVEYRAFADRLVGEETRKAIEDIRKREAERQKPAGPGGVDFPTQPELSIKPN